MTDRKSYFDDLEYWLWITKGARFSAHERCLSQNKWSNLAIGLLSAYIVIINLVALYKFSSCSIFSSETIGFSTTALSILILVFSQLENSNDLKLKAEKYHNCAKDLSEIYRKLRSIKYGKIKGKLLDQLLDNYTLEYQGVLSKHENHKEIDYEYYQATHPDDFEFNWIKRNFILFKHYCYTIFIYHLLIVLPVIVFIYLLRFCA